MERAAAILIKYPRTKNISKILYRVITIFSCIALQHVIYYRI